MNDWLRLSRWGRLRPIGLVALIALGALGLSLCLIAGRVEAQPNAQPAATRTPFSNPTATPPTQGGNGANTFYVYCMPCHGDVGQGLTDEFRNREYPPEDVNCWKSGCHGARPYENGFTLPMTIPLLIGPGALAKFQTAQELYGFIRGAMPFNAPGSLTDTQYVNVTAFLLEGNQIVPAGVQLNTSALAAIKLREGLPSPDDGNTSLWIGLIIFAGIATLLSILTRPRRNKNRGTGNRD
jgi:mono/diheme cytochrome c family protein